MQPIDFSDVPVRSNIKAILEMAHTNATGSSAEINIGTNRWRTYTRYAQVVNTDWYNEPKLRWTIDREDRVIGYATANVGSYNLPQNAKLSNLDGDSVRVEKTLDSGTKRIRHYSIVGADKLGTRDDAVSNYGGYMLRFGVIFEAGDELIGGEIIAPLYVAPDVIDDSTTADFVPKLPNTNYLMYGIAAKIASNDIFNRERVPGLLTQQNKAMEAMIRDNNDAPARKVDYGPPPLGNTVAF